MITVSHWIAENDLALWTILLGVVGNVACALLGCYLVLRRLSLLGDAISHAVLPGLVLAFLISGQTTVVPMFLGAMAMGVATAFLTQMVHGFGRVPEDASMGVVFTSLFAIGVILITRYGPNLHVDADCVLYGLIELAPLDTFNVAGLDVPRALWPLSLALIATVVFTTLFWKELKIASFDPLLATSMGVSAVLMHYLLMGMVAAVTVAAFESVGSILVIAMLIVPPAAAQLLADRLGTMMFVAAIIAGLSAVFGYLGAVYFDTSVAGMMAVAAGAQFALAVLLAPRHGLVSKAISNLALGVRIVSEDIVAFLYRGEEVARDRRISWRFCVEALGAVALLALPRLWRRGQIRLAPGGQLQLTDAGRDVARSLVRSHRLWEAFLAERFNLPPDHLHDPAERIEHYIGPRLQQQLADAVEQSAKDPHGRAIPDASGPPTGETS